MNDDLKYSFPWHGNDIYLESNDNQVKAVCSNKDIAKFLAAAANQNEYRDDYLESVLDFQRKTMALLENTTTLNYALNALSASMVNVTELSNQQQQLARSIDQLSASSLSSSSIVNEVSDKYLAIQQQLRKFTGNQDTINKQMSDVSYRQQLESTKLGVIYATQNNISQQFNNISAAHDKMLNSFSKVQNDNANLHSGLSNIAKCQKECSSQLSELKTQQNVLTYNLDKVTVDSKSLNDNMARIADVQKTITDNISKISASIDESQLAVSTFHELKTQGRIQIPENATVQLNAKVANDLVVSAKCLLMAMKHVDFDTTSLNAKVLKLSYKDFLVKIIDFENLVANLTNGNQQ